MNSLSATIALVLSSAVAGQGSILAVSWTGGSSLIDSAAGSATPLGASGAANLNSMARDPVSGNFYTVAGPPSSTAAALLDTISPVSGAAISTGVALTVSDVRGLAITATGTCYAIVDGAPDKLYTINLGSGAATLVGNTGSSSLQALAASSSGALFGWAVNPAGGGGTLLSINPATGASLAIGPGSGAIQSLAFSPSGVLYGCNSTLYTINTMTGAVTPVGTGGLGDVRGIEFVAPPSVSFLPASAQVTPGGALTVLYSAPGHAWELFVPVISCTSGNTPIPGLSQPLGIAWDACTDFYFNHPDGIIAMPLSGVPGFFIGTLDSTGVASGLVLPPAGAIPAGLNIPMHVTFLSWDPFYNFTVHGVGTFVLN